MYKSLCNKNIVVVGMICAMTGISGIVMAAEIERTDIRIIGKVVSKTCSFDTADQTVFLDDIAVSDFTDNTIKAPKSFAVDFSCGAGVSSVNIKLSGQPDSNDATAFRNKSDAKNVALRLLDNDMGVLGPSNSKVTVTPISGRGSYTFTAGYVATADNVTEGGFQADVGLNFMYD